MMKNYFALLDETSCIKGINSTFSLMSIPLFYMNSLVMQDETVYENVYVGDLPENDVDLTDDISWAQLPESGYSNSISLASKYAGCTRYGHLPRDILAYKAQRIQTVGDELA